MSDDLLFCHPVFVVELLHTAVNPTDYRRLREDLDKAFDWVWPDSDTTTIALEMQRRMATTAPAGQRVKTADLLIAALAVQRGSGVLHYDRDYDVISQRAGSNSRANGSRHAEASKEQASVRSVPGGPTHTRSGYEWPSYAMTRTWRYGPS